MAATGEPLGLRAKIIIRAGLVLFRSSKLQSAGNLPQLIAGTVGFRQFTLLFTLGGAVERGCEWGLIFERNFKFQRAVLLVFAMHRDFYGTNLLLTPK